MFAQARRSLRLPITLAVVMIVLVIALIVGWVLLAAFGASADPTSAGIYWAVLSIGTVFLALILAGVVIYLVLSIKAINLGRRQSNFIDSVTHELKSPIASLKLCLQTLNRRQVPDEQREEFYRLMLDDVERLDLLINHVLDAARLDKPPDSELAQVDLAELLADCAATVCLRYRVSTDVVQLELEPCQITAPTVDVEMIFRNLIDNAVKYAGQTPKINVTLHVQDNHSVVVGVQDNGRGVPPKLRRRIFGRFERLGLELTREKPGTGLGLYIVRTLLRRLGGRVRVRDAKWETGTLFEVTLPGASRPDGAGGQGQTETRTAKANSIG